MSERNNRKEYTGRVVSDKMDKTITVLVETYKFHKLYGKRVKYSNEKWRYRPYYGNATSISYKTIPSGRSSRRSSNYIIKSWFGIRREFARYDSTRNSLKSC